ncbi:Homocysteine S-methyltransferase [Mycena vitilis]|nr:Homocysteine S-methyltransferase [Mycena vitilis]
MSEAADIALSAQGTTLETSLDISHTPLWSAKAAIEHPEAVVGAHLAFLRAGARVILTSTYQCSSATFSTAGYSDAEAREIMVQCVRLAAEARSRFCAEQREPEDAGSTVKIALSLGPFGAGLAPAQEFDGYYPPPFGPRGYTHGTPNDPASLNCNAFAKDDAGGAKEDEATKALAQFHFERLCIFAEDEKVWDALDFVAFETVPLVREIRAIRMAMRALHERKPVKSKPWWISFVFPGGKFPETETVEGDDKVSVRSVVGAALGNSPSPGSDGSLPIPSALGINCTETEAIPGILVEMEAAVLQFGVAHENPPWLVLYPNGGDVYDPVTQTWEVKTGCDVWAEKLGDIVAKLHLADSTSWQGGVWAGVVAGGCCRTKPQDIGLLSKRLGSFAGNL